MDKRASAWAAAIALTLSPSAWAAGAAPIPVRVKVTGVPLPSARAVTRVDCTFYDAARKQLYGTQAEYPAAGGDVDVPTVDSDPGLTASQRLARMAAVKSMSCQAMVVIPVGATTACAVKSSAIVTRSFSRKDLKIGITVTPGDLPLCQKWF